MIWTTTAWTIPANQALNLNPKLEYALVDTERGLPGAGAPSLVEACLARFGLRKRRRHRTGESSAASVPPSRWRMSTRATTASRPFIWPTTRPRRRHRHRALVARLRPGRLQLLRQPRTGMKYDDILNPVQGNGSYAADFPAVRRPEHLEGRCR